jgi:hypothetical protein
VYERADDGAEHGDGAFVARMVFEKTGGKRLKDYEGAIIVCAREMQRAVRGDSE